MVIKCPILYNEYEAWNAYYQQIRHETVPGVSKREEIPSIGSRGGCTNRFVVWNVYAEPIAIDCGAANPISVANESSNNINTQNTANVQYMIMAILICN